MKKIQLYSLLASVLMLMFSCNPEPEIDNETMLDGDKIFDLSLTHPEDYLLSLKYPVPTETQKNTPVLIAAHGYSATTFEWDEIKEYAASKGTFMVSQVLLGGHGRTYQAFKEASWEDWQSSIKEEYEALSDLGYKKIYLVGSSTGAPLVLNLIKTGYFDGRTTPKGFFLVDPIVVSTNKTLVMVGLLGPVLGYTSITMDPGEAGKWYTYRPQESLKQLMELIDLTRRDLEKGIKLPAASMMKIYKSRIDGTADPVSAVMLYKGIRTSSGEKVQLEMVDSKLHVFTRLRGRDGVKPNDVVLQLKAFDEMETLMTQP
jgi:carboxylesterase